MNSPHDDAPDKIEITEAMIEAGVRELDRDVLIVESDLVRRVFEAMVQARGSEAKKSA